MQRLRVGQRIHNSRFEILALLGVGGSGEVYLAKDHHNSATNNQVALKVYFEISSSDAPILELNARIKREIEALAQIQIDSVVQAFELIFDNDLSILVQEYLPGGTLQDAMRSQSNDFNSITTWLKLAYELATGLDKIHTSGLTHGDIKPGNIGFRDLGHNQPVYLDFGQASLIHQGDFLSRPTRAMATLPYLAPERSGFIKAAKDEQADLYSLGATLYEVACGHPPFQESSPKALLEKILNGVATPLHEVNPEMPAPLSDIIQKLLRKNPEERYSTASGLAYDLKACIDQLNETGRIREFALGKRDKCRELNNQSIFVGRTAELDKLLMQLTDSLEGRGGCAFIGAPSGAGKSRLCYEVGMAASQSGVRTLIGKFSEFERNVPLSGILSVIHGYMKEMSLEPESELKAWARATADAIGPRLRLVTQRLTSLRSVFPFTHELQNEEYEDESRMFLETLVDLLVSFGSRDASLILVLDDLQWSDPESLSVIEIISTRARKGMLGKLLLLGSYRSNEVNQEHPLHLRVLQHEGPQAHVQLGPLSEEESNAMVESLLDEKGSQVTKLSRMTYLLTQGNPFYIREYLSFCLNKEIFHSHSDDGTWVFDSAKAQGASLTHGIASLVSDRIAELNNESKQLLLVASIVGNEVPLAAVDFMLEDKEQQNPLLRSLAELSEKHLIYFNRDTLTFVHDKVREAAYQMAGHDLRTDCHHAYAVWLDQKISSKSAQGASINIEPFELAFHLKNGRPQRNPEWARNILYTAGRMALKLFAYQKALEYAQTAHQLLPADFTTDKGTLLEFVKISELLGDARVLNEDPVGAVDLYTHLLDYISDDLHRTELLAKLCECNLTLFRYRDSIEAGMQGVKLLKRDIDSQEGVSLLRIIFLLIPFCLQIIQWKLFGKSTKEIASRREEIFLKLLINLQVALFFSRPICAISNQMRFTFTLLRYKPNEYSALIIGYWAVASGVFGFAKISNKLYRSALQYFEQHPNPIARSFLLFTWGYLNEFPRGRLREAHAKHLQALDALENAGESFWRVLTMQGLIHMDEYGLGNGETYALLSRYTNLIFRIKQTPTILDAVLRHHLLTKNIDELQRYEKIVAEAALSIQSDGFDTIDSCYANLSLGEIHLLRDDPVSALPYIQTAFRSVIRHVHRVSYCIFAPTLMALCYIRVNRPIAALPALALAWVNQIFSAKLLLPKTTYVTGELFYRNRMKVLGRWICQRGIQKANNLRQPATLFELRLNFANLIVDDDPEYAMVIFRMCREYFSERQFLFLVEKCDRGLMKAQLNTETAQAKVTLRSGSSRSHDSITPSLHLKNSKSEFIRNKIELDSLLQVFLNLSSLNEKDPLYDAVLDAMCRCTGVDYGVLLIFEEGKLTPVRARGCTLEELGTNLNPMFGLDKWFLEKCELENKREPRIRPTAWRTPHPACDGSAMVVPLPYKEKIYGYCYLANQGVNNYFDARSQRVVTPLAAQAAIAYQNLIFASAKEEKARLDAELIAARNVQDALLPNRIEVPQTQISYFYESASQTGGDWFHHHHDKIRNRLYVFVGDVTGHGLPSAMMTAVVSGALQSHLKKEFERDCSKKVSIEESLRELSEIANFAVFWAGTRSNRYMTMSFTCLDLTTGEFGVVNAGHTPPYILRGNENKVSGLPCSGSLLGFSEEASFGYARQDLQPGDSVLIYTDGLIENTVDEKQIVSPRSLRKVMETEKEPKKCIDALAASITNAMKLSELEDDVTVYMLRWEGREEQQLPLVS